MKTLQIVETAYRATLEEQDDTVVWLTHAMVAAAGGRFGMLLMGNAVCYVARDQRAPPLAFGGWRQSHAPDLAADVAALAANGVALMAVEEDLEERGLLDVPRIGGVTVVAREELPRILAAYDRVWKW